MARIAYYIGMYEDWAKAKAAALKKGMTSDDEVADYVEPGDFRTSRRFATKPEAVRWLRAEIKARRTTYGVGDIVTVERVPLAERCDYCTCQGERPASEATVEAEGIVEEVQRNDCAWQDDE
jgi:hypothetical protein